MMTETGRFSATEAMAHLVLLAEGQASASEFVEWCEDAETPGFLGAWAGVTDRERRKLKVSTHSRSFVDQVAVLYHEVEHALGAEWATDFPERHLHCGGSVSFGEIARRRPTKREEEPCGGS